MGVISESPYLYQDFCVCIALAKLMELQPSVTAGARALLSFPVTSGSHSGQSCGGCAYQAPDGSGLWSLGDCRRKGSPETPHCSRPAPGQPRRSKEPLQALPTVQVGCPIHNSTHGAALLCSPSCLLHRTGTQTSKYPQTLGAPGQLSWKLAPKFKSQAFISSS